jgi:hypothetical protein
LLILGRIPLEKRRREDEFLRQSNNPTLTVSFMSESYFQLNTVLPQISLRSRHNKILPLLINAVLYGGARTYNMLKSLFKIASVSSSCAASESLLYQYLYWSDPRRGRVPAQGRSLLVAAVLLAGKVGRGSAFINFAWSLLFIRETRVALLSNLELYRKHLSKDLLNLELFPKLAMGLKVSKHPLQKYKYDHIFPIFLAAGQPGSHATAYAKGLSFTGRAVY